MKVKQLYTQLCACAVFRGVLNQPIFTLFKAYCQTEGSIEEKIDAYAAFVSEIYAQGGHLTELVKTIVFSDENVYIKSFAHGKTIPVKVKEAAKSELKLFGEFAALTRQDFALDMAVEEDILPAFDSLNKDMVSAYQKVLRNLHKYGYGIFSPYAMFRFTDQKEVEPIVSADKIQLSQFVGYEEERGQVIANTRAFLEGKPAANVLLCGDAGAGKSSTVKAVANAYFDEGLRLIELRKDQLHYLPEVMAKISGNPLKFIIFIDDLSFYQNDDNFGMLKAALEGSASAMADNAVIYATSNRRHIIKESFSDRDGDDVHRNDTMQETLSLSERFGLTVLFSKPNKQLYLHIVKELAKRFEIVMDEKELEIQAEAFALRKGNRSARAAEQFINHLISVK